MKAERREREGGRGGDKESVQNWIDAGVNVNGTDYTNHTPLMVARASGQPDIAQLLVDAGATS